MNKKAFTALIGLMTLAIVGLVVVQLYWINQSYEAGKNDFSRKVNLALEETVEKVRENELENYYKIFEDSREKLKDSVHNPQIVVSQIETDSANVKYVYLTRYMIDQVALPISGIYGDSLNVTELYSEEREIKINKKEGKRKFSPLDVNLKSNFTDGSYTLERFAQFDAGNKPIYNRVNLIELDSIIKRKLLQFNIEIPYEFGIISSDSSQVKLKTQGFQLSSQNYVQPLFKDNKNENTHFLSLYIPAEEKEIFDGITPLFIVTIFFTLLIVGVYWSTLMALFKQRKISSVKTDFMNNMTHEFKTPLATIGVATDALKTKMISTNPEKVKHYANLIKTENKRMNSQVEMVLRMSQLERDQIRLDKEITSLDDIVRDSVDSIRLLIENRNGTIFEKYESSEDELSVDGFHIGNIVLNVLDNAVKYSPENIEIRVKTFNERGFYIIQISDKGLGMGKMVQNNIFDKFYRAETGNVHNVKGHGLGLSYVKKIVELHDGTIDVKSEKGKGSTFSIKLPLN